MENILLQADRLTSLDRQSTYGHPHDDFSRTAKFWSEILGMQCTPEQVALCMIAVKLSREVNAHKLDNLTDIAGYARTLQLVKEKEEELATRPVSPET